MTADTAIPSARHRLGRGSVALVVAGLALAACGARAPRPPLPAPPPAVDVRLSEYRFDYAPDVRAGRVVFRVHNAGAVPHRISLVPLPDDFPPIDEQLRGSVRRVITPFAGLTTRQPGETASFAVDLEAGRRYAFLCALVDPDNVSHARKGMSSEFRTPQPQAAITEKETKTVDSGSSPS